MGCLSSKFGIDQPGRPQHGYGQQGYGQHYGQPAVGRPVASQPWGQPGGYQQTQAAPQQPLFVPDSPFLRTAAPDGQPWSQHLRGAPLYVDESTGLLAGPWAECLCWCVKFENESDWQDMPEYRDGEGPAGGVLSSLAMVVAQRMDSQQLMAAAERLEEAAHEAVRAGRPLPCQSGCAVVQPGRAYAAQHAGDGYGGQQNYGQGGPPPFYGQGEMCGSYQQPGQQGYGRPSYEQRGWDQPSYGGQQYGAGTGGPTLLGNTRPQGQTAGSGMGKMAMAGAAGLAAGAGGMYAAQHMGGIGDVVGDGIGLVGHGFEGAGNFVGGAFEDVGDFVGDIFD